MDFGVSVLWEPKSAMETNRPKHKAALSKVPKPYQNRNTFGLHNVPTSGLFATLLRQ